MQWPKKILFSLLSIFLVYQSSNLLQSFLFTSPAQLSLSENLIVAFLINLFITGIFAFPGFVFPTHRLLPNFYYRIVSPAALKVIYRMLRVALFKKLLLLFFWGKTKNRKRYFNGTKGGLQNLIYQSKQSEFGHFGALVLIEGINLWLLIRGFTLICFISSLLNFVGNLYPILLQRYHRMRINRLAP